MPVSALSGGRILAQAARTATQPAPLRIANAVRHFHPAPVKRAQKFKYKTVEEAKARYRSGVRSFGFLNSKL